VELGINEADRLTGGIVNAPVSADCSECESSDIDDGAVLVNLADDGGCLDHNCPVRADVCIWGCAVGIAERVKPLRQIHVAVDIEVANLGATWAEDTPIVRD